MTDKNEYLTSTCKPMCVCVFTLVICDLWDFLSLPSPFPIISEVTPDTIDKPTTLIISGFGVVYMESYM